MIDWHNQRVQSAGFGLALWLLASIYLCVNTLRPQLTIDLVADAPDSAQLFYSRDGHWNEAESLAYPLNTGWNRIMFALPSLRIGANVRFDPGRRATTYRILAVHWMRGGIDYAVPMDALSNPRSDASSGLTLANGQLQLSSSDDDAQLIVPAPDGKWRLLSTGLPLGAPLAGLILVYLGVRKSVGLPRMAGAFLSVCSLFYFVACLALGPLLPLFDDWRYLWPGPFDLVDGDWQWLRVVSNDTYFFTSQVLDFIVLKLSNVDFFWLRAVAVGLLMLQVAMQYRVISRAASARPAIAAVGVALGIWSLASGAYWGGTAVAYQQALPTLFGTLMLAHLITQDGSLRRPASIPLLLVCCMASGLSYISGGLLILSLGAACLLTFDWRPTRSVPTRTGWILLGVGAGLLLLQLILVTRQQGSLLEHNHAVASIFPNDRRFWFFFSSLFGRALGYTGQSALIDALLTTLTLFPALVLGTARLREASHGDESQPNKMWVMLALYAGIGSALYAAVVAFGRAGFVPANSSVAAIVASGKGRFHYWPIAAMLPYVWLGWAAIAQRLQRGAAVLRTSVATLLLLPKSLLAFDLGSSLCAVDRIAQTGAHCLVGHLADIETRHPVVCTDLTGVSMDIGPIVAKLRARNSPLYRMLVRAGGVPLGAALPTDQLQPAVGASDDMFHGGFEPQ